MIVNEITFFFLMNRICDLNPFTNLGFVIQNKIQKYLNISQGQSLRIKIQPFWIRIHNLDRVFFPEYSVFWDSIFFFSRFLSFTGCGELSHIFKTKKAWKKISKTYEKIELLSFHLRYHTLYKIIRVIFDNSLNTDCHISFVFFQNHR